MDKYKWKVISTDFALKDMCYKTVVERNGIVRTIYIPYRPVVGQKIDCPKLT